MKLKYLLVFPAALILVAIAYYVWTKPEHPYAIAVLPTPVLYTSDFPAVFGGQDGTQLKFDDYGEIDELEFIALPGTTFRIKKDLKQEDGRLIYKVVTADYPYDTEKGYYIDSRFVHPRDEEPKARKATLPDRDILMQNLLSASGSMYTWGGNWNTGVADLLAFYPPQTPLEQSKKDQWMLKGVDCSGLLYEATDGYTPRNTSALVTYGKAVDIQGKTADEIVAALQPLDLIVWKGHLMIVIDGGKTIESRLDYDTETDGQQGGGVRVRDLKQVVEETLKVRTAVNDYDTPVPEGPKNFVVRRWFGNA